MSMDLRIDSVTMWSLDQLTAWRNEPLLDPNEKIFRLVTAEFGYLGLSILGLIESVVRLFFAGPALIIYPCTDEEGKKRIWAVLTSLLIGNGLLSLEASISSLALLFLNPCKSRLEESDLQICCNPCFI